jgi:hypothetical protein
MAYAPTQPGIDTSDIGAANAQALTLFDSEPYLPSFQTVGMSGAEDSAGAMATGAMGHPAGGNPTWAIVGLLGGLVLLGFIRNSSEHLRSNTIALNAFNFTLMILTVMIGFVLVKVVVAKYPIPGLTQLAHAA